MTWYTRKKKEPPIFQSLKNYPATSTLTDLRQALTSRLPRYCELCVGEIETEANYGRFCRYCLESLVQPANYRSCDQCDLPLGSINHSSEDNNETYHDQLIVDSYCGECLKQQPSFDKILCGHIFQHPIDSLINRFKHHKGHYLAEALTYNLITRVKHEYFVFPDILIPVPIHWSKRLQRGYNQSDLLAHTLSQQLQIPWQRVLRKSRRTSLQQGLNRKQRLRNLKSSFTCPANTQSDIAAYEHVALVDDVITTGATAEEIAKYLKSLGVARVDVWGIARTPK